MADFLVKTTEDFVFEINKQDIENLDIVKSPDNKYNFIYNNKSYIVSVINSDINNKKYTISVNGKEIQLNIKDSLDQMLDKMGFSNNKKHGTGEIKSPMPGMVLHIDVEEGQEVAKGDTLLVLEAMKMENLIKAPTGGTVKSIDVKKGDAVAKNQILIVIA